MGYKKGLASVMSKSASYATLIMLFLLVVYPLFWTLMSSFKLNWEIFGNPVGFPRNPTFYNYVKVIKVALFPTYFFNSILITVFGTVGRVILSALAGYGFARFRFKGSDTIFLLFIISLALPGASIMVSECVLLSVTHLISTYQGIILFYMALNAFAIILFRNAFRAIPQDFVDAAIVDGCGELRIFATIMLPLIRPTLATVVIFTSIWIWNDFLWPYLILQKPGQETIIVGMFTLCKSKYFVGYGILTAGLTISLIPILVVYMVFQRHYIKGLTLGGIKG